MHNAPDAFYRGSYIWQGETREITSRVVGALHAESSLFRSSGAVHFLPCPTAVKRTMIMRVRVAMVTVGRQRPNVSSDVSLDRSQ